MSKLNSELKNEALTALRGNWAMAAILTLVYALLLVGVSQIPAIGRLLMLLITFPLAYGITVLFYDLFRKKRELKIDSLFEGFSDYARIWGTGFLVYLYTFLWLLLLIVPGIIKSYSYSLVYYILIDEPDLKYNAAIEKSMKMMDGHKMRLFLLHLSFIGWGILSLFTFGLGYFLLAPYMQTTMAAFYEDLKRERKDSEEVTASIEE